MGRLGLAVSEARDVRERLRHFYLTGPNQRAANASDLAQRLRVSPSTVSGWFGGQPKTPDLSHIVKMAAQDRLSPTWVLLGRGAELLDAPVPDADVSELLWQSVAAALQSLRGASPAFLRQFLPPPGELWAQIVEDCVARLNEYLRARHAVGARTIVRIEKVPRSPSDATYQAIRKYRADLDSWSPAERAAFKRRALRLKFPKGRHP